MRKGSGFQMQAAVAGWMRWRPKAAVAGCAGGRGLDRTGYGRELHHLPPANPARGRRWKGEGKFGGGDEPERRQRFSPTLIRAAGGT